jgi:NAD(P)-dependent dehydrogenase (short-subunit alcohol dehydrogenase family)
MLPLKDKTVLVIGQGSGIARAIALAVSEHGGRVIAAGVTRTNWATRVAAWVPASSRSTSRTSPRSARRRP